MANVCCALDPLRDQFPMPTLPDWPKLRAGTQLDAIYERLSATGHGFHRSGVAAGLPRVIVVFDTRCGWSNNFWQISRAVEREIDFVWYPVCVSADYSTAQAACILAARDSWELMCRHEEAFHDQEFSGIRAEEFPATQADRDRVWENARIYRKAGGTSVPLGIYRTPGGSYVPLFGDSSASDMRAAVARP